jgi:oligopeptidase A
MSLITKMARSPDRAMNLINVLRKSAYRQGEKELECLTEFAQQTLNLSGPLKPWNRSFVSERYRETTLKYDEEMVARHFPFPHVLSCMFLLAEQLFGVKIREINRVTTPNAPSVWHKDVKVFEIRDRDDQHSIAYFYGDFYR